jgi:DNA-directed RNA polymerase beta' subunit
VALDHAQHVFDADPGPAADADRLRAVRHAREVVKELGSPAARRRRRHVLMEFGTADVVQPARTVLRRHGPAAARRWVLGRLRARQERLWNLVEEVTHNHPVMLNRAPTLHRMGIQAFEPVLVEGNALRLHPLVCKAFNADFDGDQMAVHLPLSIQARAEAAVLMMPTNNLFNPASGQIIVGPSQDMVMGCHYLTAELPAEPAADVRAIGTVDEEAGRRPPPPPAQFTPPGTDHGAGAVFAGPAEVLLAHALGKVGTHARVRLRLPPGRAAVEEGHEHEAGEPRRGMVTTTVGRVLFDDVLPPGLPFYNLTLTARRLNRVLADCHRLLGQRPTVELADRIKRLGFEAATRSGLSFAADDIPSPRNKAAILAATRKSVDSLRAAYRRGDLEASEYALRLLDRWSEAHKQVTAHLLPDLRHDTRDGRSYLNPLFVQVDSGARGSLDQLRQLAGMRGLMASVSGRVIERSITASLREGLPSWDYFLSAHGARKGLTDKGVRTAEAGYLTRKLIDAAQRVVVTAHDCGTHQGIAKRGPDLAGLVRGRVSLYDVAPPCGPVLVRADELITPEQAGLLAARGVPEFWVRSPLTCAADGVCQLCYGTDLATGRLVEMGSAVGVIAGQSIGEPGTQLTLHTFRLGGLAGKDILNDLERVTRLLEAKPVGDRDPAALMDAWGPEAVREYFLGELRAVYRQHGLEIDDRHFEVVLARLLAFVRVTEPGDTDLLPEQVLERRAFDTTNAGLPVGARPATCRPHLLGLTRAASAAPGFLAAASFQRSVAVLTEAALAGRVDCLVGLKENVMLGRLIPAGTGLKRRRTVSRVLSEPEA